MSGSAPSTSSSSGTISPGSSPSGEAGALQAIGLALGRFVFRYRNALAPAALGLTIALTDPIQFAGSEAWDLGLDVVGFVVGLVGQTLRVTVIGLAYIKRGGRNKTISADRLVCDGVFAHSRNPLYVGNFLMLTGLLLIWHSPWAYLLVLPVVAVSFLSIVRAEEQFLRQHFGAEYEAYCARVNRFIPSFRGLRQTLARFDFDWKRVIRKEYGTTFAWISVALMLFVLEKISWHGMRTAAFRAGFAGIVWLCALGLWATARWLKKTRRLQSPD